MSGDRAAEPREAGAPDTRPTRRDVMRHALTLCALSAWPAALPTLGAAQDGDAFAGLVSLARPRTTPLNRRLGDGLDARLFTDLSTLTRDALETPGDRFYVRTSCPVGARDTAGWQIRIASGSSALGSIAATDLVARSIDVDDCLMECSGNGDPDNFGLMSSARWRGVPMTSLLAPFEEAAHGRLIRVVGEDDDRSVSGTSVPGASWIFPPEALGDAFLATSMSGQPLTADHGAPVRLVVPGWYGCTCIKWVRSIDFVDADTPATAHMLEFAARTHQRRGLTLAREFAPAAIQHAAMPIRVERWRRGDRSFYKVVGILWGGARPTNALLIGLGEKDPYVPVSDCPLPATTRTWTLWSHLWQPERPGRYEISLRIADRTLPTLRLDAGFYRRWVTITDV